MVAPDMAPNRIALGKVQVYLGAVGLAEVRKYRDLFGGVTLQGIGGLKLAQELDRINDLNGIDLDPAVYLNSQGHGSQLSLDLDTERFDWVKKQQDLGLSVIRTAGSRIPAGKVDLVKAELVNPCGPEDGVTVQLVLDGGWLSARHVDSLESELTAADRNVSLVLAGVFNPLDTSGKISGLRRLLCWARTAGRQFELLRTDMAGIAGVSEGASLAAVGLGTSTRHFGLPMSSKQRTEYERRQRSALVFVPRLLHWQRGNVLGSLAPWRGAGVTECDCFACEAAGKDLLRFDAVYGNVPVQVRNAAREHDALALAQVAARLAAASDPRRELGDMARAAMCLARTVAATYKVQLDPSPAWVSSWAGE